MQKKMLIITKHLNIGGTEKMLLRILPIFISFGYKIDLYLLYNYGMHIDFEFDFGYNTDQLALFSIFPYKTNGYKQLMKSEPQKVYYSVINDTYDIEIAFQESYATKIISTSQNKKSKKIAWVHSNFQEYHFSANAYDSDEEELNAYSKFDQIVFCSESAKNAFDKTLKNNFRNKEVIYSLTDSAYCKECARQYQHQVRGSHFLVLSRYSPQKGLDRLIKAARLLKDCNILFKIIIVGNGELEHDIREMITAYDLINEVYMAPAVPNPFPYFKNCISYVSPSYTESFGLAMQEALCMHVPVIACDTPGTREVLKNGLFGEIVEPSEYALADAMKKCILDSDYKNILCKKADNGADYWDKWVSISKEKLETLLSPYPRI
ncbi:MAG: glycosyltransferase [Eubacterium sp.]|nr:glycosyltransferase [Eubacterium sp.]